MKYLFLLLMVSFTAQAQNSSLIEWKKNSGALSSSELKELIKNYQDGDLEVLEPHSEQKVTYQVLDFFSLLTKIYGKKWQSAYELAFICADGYIAHVPMKQILRYQPVLAYGRKGGPFQVNNLKQHEKNVDLGPLYLIWNNLKYPKLQENGAKNWPYQVVGINLEAKNPLLSLLPKSAEHKKGYDLFMKNCVQCHSIGGVGGAKGPELTVLVKEQSEKEIKDFILNPRQKNAGSTMPAMFEGKKDAALKINQLYHYLKSKI